MTRTFEKKNNMENPFKWKLNPAVKVTPAPILKWWTVYESIIYHWAYSSVRLLAFLSCKLWKADSHVETLLLAFFRTNNKWNIAAFGSSRRITAGNPGGVPGKWCFFFCLTCITDEGQAARVLWDLTWCMDEAVWHAEPDLSLAEG